MASQQAAQKNDAKGVAGAPSKGARGVETRANQEMVKTSTCFSSSLPMSVMERRLNILAIFAADPSLASGLGDWLERAAVNERLRPIGFESSDSFMVSLADPLPRAGDLLYAMPQPGRCSPKTVA